MTHKMENSKFKLCQIEKTLTSQKFKSFQIKKSKSQVDRTWPI